MRIILFVAILALVVGCAAPASQDNTVEMNDNSTNETVNLPVKEVNMEVFQYDFEPSTITVKKGQTVRITATSVDVDHGIAIPEFGVSQTISAGETVTFEFTPDRTGEFRFFCNVYCGSGHSSMAGTLIVE